MYNPLKDVRIAETDRDQCSINLKKSLCESFFPGYFTPSQEEFNGIWGECLFGFDASVLLGLYRSSADTQDVFFRILELVADRIFLPNQAAAEYLRNRLGVISIRSDSYKRIREESNKFANAIGLLVQEQSPPRGAEIAAIAKKAADQIGTIIESAAKDEPDRLRSDDLLTRLEALFETKTGERYPDSMLKEIFEEGARRYEQRIPPGYKDDKKAEPDKYGDLLIWFQLIDKAKVEQKPIIFVTRDAKEDWWLQPEKKASVHVPSFGRRWPLRRVFSSTCIRHRGSWNLPRNSWASNSTPRRPSQNSK